MKALAHIIGGIAYYLLGFATFLAAVYGINQAGVDHNVSGIVAIGLFAAYIYIGIRLFDD